MYGSGALPVTNQEMTPASCAAVPGAGPAGLARAAYRDWFHPELRLDLLGFRVVVGAGARTP